MTAAKRPRPPDSLDTTGAALWRDVTKVYELSPAELALLGRCCRTVDVLSRIDVALLDSDLVVEGSVGQLRAHPLLSVKADQERVLDSLLRALALPMPDEDEGRRRSAAAVAAAQARWREQRSG
jgi:phage terminase small subunit